jgi:glutamate-1-semialdehyde aminotransferase
MNFDQSKTLKQKSSDPIPVTIEVKCAETLLDLANSAEIATFAKNGLDVTTAAVKLAHADTSHDLVANGWGV